MMPRREYIDIADQLEKDIPGVSMELARNIIKSFQTTISNNRVYHCDICGSKRKSEDFRFQSSYDFLYTCKAHRKYKGWLDVWKVRKIENVKFTGFYDF